MQTFKTFSDYQKAVRKFTPKSTEEVQLAVLALGSIGESGELAAELKSFPSCDWEKVWKELGDCCWYPAAIANWFNVQIDLDIEGFEQQHHLPPHPISIERMQLNLVQAASALSECIKKMVGHGHRPPHTAEVYKMVLDIYVSVCVIASAVDAVMADAPAPDSPCLFGWVMEQNIARLESRYPDGFSHKASRERKC